MVERQIIAMGGGGFTMEPENPALDEYVLAAARAETPAVGFLATASGDSDAYIEHFYASFANLPCRPSHLPLFSRTPDLRTYLLAQDVIYVGGGNTKSMLGVWREWGLPERLREAWEAGVVLAGVSAGAVCWFEAALSDAYEGSLRVIPCLGFLAGSCVVHYDSGPERRPEYHRRVGAGEIAPGLALDNSAAVHFIGDQIHRVVASRSGVTAYRVGVENGAVREEALAVEHIVQGLGM
ncbi:MAG TPA: peptidase E [Thermoanaerobaculia bacterium]|jgi:peptidase E